MSTNFQDIFSHSSPSMKKKMAWQNACQSSSSSGGPHLLSPAFVVSMRGAQPTFFTSLKRQLFRPFTGLCFWASDTELGLDSGEHHQSFSKSPMFTASWLSTMMNLPSSSIIFDLLLFFETLNQHLHRTISSQLFTTSCSASSRASLKPTKCSLQPDTDDSEGTRTTV